ncbi:MAG: hypothetical protein AAGI36_11220 [Pseudomonadota bacterium]
MFGLNWFAEKDDRTAAALEELIASIEIVDGDVSSSPNDQALDNTF